MMKLQNRWLPADTRFKYVRFHPAVGRSYVNSRFGLRILILGESQYCWDAMPENESHITLGAISSCDTYPFWKKLARLFSDGEFWGHVMFYNYVQDIVGKGSRSRPTPRMWQSKAAINGFKEVLHTYKPQRILVIGKTTWRYMAGAKEFPEGPPIEEPRFRFSEKFNSNLAQSEQCAYWYPTVKGQFALAAPIYHPGYPAGFHQAETKRVADRLLKPTWKAPKFIDRATA
jgi:hypothetical protein